MFLRFLTGIFMYCSYCGRRTYWSSSINGDYETFTCQECGGSHSVRTR